MSETSQSPVPLSRPPEDLHWGIVYLREDIQDLRGEIRAVYVRLDQTAQELRSEIQGSRNEIQGSRNEFQAGFLAVNARIDRTTQELRSEIQGSRNEFQTGFLTVNARIDQTNQRLDAQFEFLLKRLDNRFLWMITTMIALSGIIVTIFKI